MFCSILSNHISLGPNSIVVRNLEIESMAIIEKPIAYGVADHFHVTTADAGTENLRNINGIVSVPGRTYVNLPSYTTNEQFFKWVISQNRRHVKVYNYLLSAVKKQWEYS